MDISLDEAESAFLQAVLTGAETCVDVLLRPEGAGRKDAVVVSDTSVVTGEGVSEPPAFSPLVGTRTSASGDTPGLTINSQGLLKTWVPLPHVTPPQQQQQQLQQQSRLSAWSASQPAGNPFGAQPFREERLSPPRERQQQQLPPPATPPLQVVTQHHAQHGRSSPSDTRQRRGALSPVQDVVAAGGSGSPSQHHRGFGTAPGTRPGAPALPPRSKTSNSAPLAPTKGATIAANRSSSPLSRLPSSFSAGVISEVSAASIATNSTSTTSTSGSGRRRRISSNPGGGAVGGPVCAAAYGGKGTTAGNSRKFLSAGAIPATSDSVGPTATGSGPAGRPSGTAILSSAPSSRRAHGLLQRIQSLEAQLTELLLAEGDPESFAAVAMAASGGAELGRSPTAQMHQRHSSTSGTSASSHGGAAAGAAISRQQLIHSVVEQLCRDYNSSGVALMEAGLDEAAREQLDKALLLAGSGGPLEGRPDKQRELQIVAHNNLACYYRKFRQPALALEHLQHTARLETGAAGAEARPAETAGPADAPLSEEAQAAGEGRAAEAGNADGGVAAALLVNPQGPTAATLLNLAACSSSLGQHMQALAYAARAVQAAAGELQIPLPALEGALLQGLPQAQLWEVLPQLRRACQGATTQLAMAYYNRAVEQEHLHQWHAALESYRLAVDVASRFVGRGDDLTLTMQQSAEAFKVRLRKLERNGKVRAAKVNHIGVFGGQATGSSGGGGGPAPAAPPPSSPGAAASGAALLRPHPHLRPLLRCSTAATTSAAVHTVVTTGPAAGSAAAAAMSGLQSKAGRGTALPAIAPPRPASWTATDQNLVPPTTSGTISPVNTTFIARAATRGSFGSVAPTNLAPRRALSAGRAGPPGRLAAATTAAVAPPSTSSPPTVMGWAGSQPQARGGSCSHGAAAAFNPPMAVTVDIDAARAPHRCGGSSPPLPPKPLLAQQQPHYHHHQQQQLSQQRHQPSDSGTDTRRSGPADISVADGRGDADAGSGGDQQQDAPGPQTRACVATGAYEPGAAARGPTRPSPAPAPLGLEQPYRSSGTAPLEAASAGSLPFAPSARPGWQLGGQLSGEGSLAAMAAAAVAAAAELARICTAGEDEHGQGRRGSLVDGGGPPAGWTGDPGRGAVKAPEPKCVPVAQSTPAQLPPAGIERVVGAGGGGGEPCGKGGMGLVRAALSVGAPVGMLAPKRDGVAV